MPDRKISLAPEFALLGCLALLWGSSYLFIKVAVVEIPPLTLIAARVSIAAVLRTGLCRWYGHALPSDAGTWRRLLVQAVFNSIGAWTLLAWGQQFIASGLASVLNSTAPIFIFFITLCFTRHERTGMARLSGAMLGLCGVALIVGLDVLDGFGRSVMGQLAVIGGALLYAGAAIYGRRFSGQPAMVTAAGTMIWASLVLVPLACLLDRPWALRPSPMALGAILALGLFSTGVALVIYFRLVRTLGSMGVASQAYLRVVVGVLLGVFLLGEQVSVSTGLGVTAALCGVALINLPKRAVAAEGSLDPACQPAPNRATSASKPLL